jgi:cytosine/uracil/thiamine/allantoin permease
LRRRLDVGDVELHRVPAGQDDTAGRRGGQYWFTGGWHVGTVAAWTIGGAFGLLAVNTTLYGGPLADIAGGVDLSTVGSAAIAGLIYLASGRFINV